MGWLKNPMESKIKMSKFTIPTTFMGTDTKEAYDRVINAKTPEPISTPTTNAGKIDGFIYVPSINIYVAKERKYFNHDWAKAHEALKAEDSRMLRIPEFISFINYLTQNPSEENTGIYNDITQVRDPWRAEHLDAYFEKRNKDLYILTGNKSKAEKLESCLMEDCQADIFGSANSQGLPTLKKEGFHYWSPRDKFVARFDAYSDGAYLACDWGPSDADPVLGVRPVKEESQMARGQGVK